MTIDTAKIVPGIKDALRKTQNSPASQGVIRTLLDFSFSEFIITKVIKLIYALALVASVVSTLYGIYSGFQAGFGWGLGAVLISPVILFIYVLLVRIQMEILVVAFKMADTLNGIRASLGQLDKIVERMQVVILDGNGGRVFNNDFTSAAPLKATAVLDSVTIANGYASGGGNAECGGGMFNDHASPTIANCTFRSNRALYGGGMFNSASSTPAITKCTFSGNKADRDGGGIYNGETSPEIADCTFDANEAWHGGGMFNSGNSSKPEVKNCVFNENTAHYKGGGMYNYYASPGIGKCTFNGNESWYGGGGMYNERANPTIAGSTFSGNEADDHGGGVANLSANPTFANCTFGGNEAWYGGAVYNERSATVVAHCTFSRNKATFGGGGMYNERSSPTIVNAIVWGNVPTQQIFNSLDNSINPLKPTTTSKPKVTYSIVQGGYAGKGNKNANPQIMPLGNYGGLVQTMPVNAGSPATGASATQAQMPNGVAIPATDAIGQTRDTAKPCTMGAVEYSSVSVSIKEGGNLFAPGEAFTLTVTGVPPDSTVQWFRNGVLIPDDECEIDETGMSITTKQGDPRATYHCVITSGSMSRASAALPVKTMTIPAPVDAPTFDVYETKVTARTSTVKEMNVKVAGKTVPVHYRAPVSKTYTIVMASDGGVDVRSDGYTATGHGRMWTAGSGTAFTLGSERLAMGGSKPDASPSPIGAKGQHIPVESEYYAKGASEPLLRFTGLATVDWKNERLASSVGIVRGQDMTPLPCATKDCTTREANQGAGLEGQTLLGGIYYPQPCYMEGTEEPEPAHFHGTYATRYNATLSTKAGGDDFFGRATFEVNNRVPEGQR